MRPSAPVKRRFAFVVAAFAGVLWADAASAQNGWFWGAPVARPATPMLLPVNNPLMRPATRRATAAQTRTPRRAAVRVDRREGVTLVRRAVTAISAPAALSVATTASASIHEQPLRLYAAEVSYVAGEQAPRRPLLHPLGYAPHSYGHYALLAAQDQTAATPGRMTPARAATSVVPMATTPDRSLSCPSATQMAQTPPAGASRSGEPHWTLPQTRLDFLPMAYASGRQLAALTERALGRPAPMLAASASDFLAPRLAAY